MFIYFLLKNYDATIHEITVQASLYNVDSELSKPPRPPPD